MPRICFQSEVEIGSNAETQPLIEEKYNILPEEKLAKPKIEAKFCRQRTFRRYGLGVMV
jgi:hypothetical protein